MSSMHTDLNRNHRAPAESCRCSLLEMKPPLNDVLQFLFDTFRWPDNPSIIYYQNLGDGHWWTTEGPIEEGEM